MVPFCRLLRPVQRRSKAPASVDGQRHGGETEADEALVQAGELALQSLNTFLEFTCQKASPSIH